MLTYDSQPPQPGEVHLDIPVINETDMPHIGVRQMLGKLVASELLNRGTTIADTRQIIEQLAEELPEDKYPDDPHSRRGWFKKGAESIIFARGTDSPEISDTV